MSLLKRLEQGKDEEPKQGGQSGGSSGGARLSSLQARRNAPQELRGRAIRTWI